MGSPIWMFCFFLSSGMVIAFSVKKLYDITYVRTAQFLLLASLFRKESTFGRGATS